MATPYSLDLRERVVLLCKQMSKTKVAEVLNISRRTVHRYLKLLGEGRELAPPKGFQKGHSHKVSNKLEALRNLVEKKPSSTLHELGGKLDLSISSVHRGLKKLGITKKREHLNMWNVMKKNEKSFKNVSRT